MTTTPLLIRCGFGIGGRVTAIANALSRHAEIRFSWKVNRFLLLTHDQVFPTGIPGVEIVTDAPAGFVTRWEDGITADNYLAAGDPDRARAAYQMILQAMTGAAMTDPPGVAVLGRFHRAPEATPDSLVRTAVATCFDLGARRIFLLSDLHRTELAQALQGAGIDVIEQVSPELTEDLQRDPEGQISYFSDWKTLLSAEVIVATDSPTGILHPARAAGTHIIYSAPS
jgi:hypothetical protein